MLLKIKPYPQFTGSLMTKLCKPSQHSNLSQLHVILVKGNSRGIVLTHHLHTCTFKARLVFTASRRDRLLIIFLVLTDGPLSLSISFMLTNESCSVVLFYSWRVLPLQTASPSGPRKLILLLSDHLMGV